jgi:hypothetical protein
MNNCLTCKHFYNVFHGASKISVPHCVKKGEDLNELEIKCIGCLDYEEKNSTDK